MRLVAKDFPLTSHRQARPAAEAARCAAAEGRYWPYHERLFAEQPRFADERLIDYAVGVGLDRDAFARCLRERRFARDVDLDITQARALGVRSTPTFLINGRVLVGAHPAETFRTLIEEVLAERARPRAPRGGVERRGIGWAFSPPPREVVRCRS